MVSALENFLDWWHHELSTFIPTRARDLLEQHRNEVITELRGDRFLLFRNDGSGFRELAAVTLASPLLEKSRQIVRHALAEFPKRTPQITLALPADQVLRRRLTFPAAAEENLRQIISYEIPRRTPFDLDEVYYDVDVIDHAAKDGALTVDVRVIPRDTVNDAVAMATVLGLEPDRVGISSDHGHSASNINFLPQQTERTGKRLEKTIVTALGVLTIALLITAIVLPLERKRDISARLTDQVATMRTQVALVTRLEQEIDEARQRNHFIANERQLSPPTVAVMDDLTRLLPDDTWLFQMHLKAGHVSMQGYTNAVSALVELIESSPRFRDVAVQSNITRDQKTGQERFHITFDVAAGGG